MLQRLVNYLKMKILLVILGLISLRIGIEVFFHMLLTTLFLLLTVFLFFEKFLIGFMIDLFKPKFIGKYVLNYQKKR